MTMIRPGGVALTKKAIELARLPDGARALDVGCGGGGTVRLLKEHYGYEAIGVDVSSKMIDSAKARYPALDLRVMEAEFLDFESNTFDAVFMECFLSVARLQPDAAFEAYCTLKPGGKLILTDLYRRNPDPAKVAVMLAEAREKAGRPKVEGACGENSAPSFVMLDGAFVVDELAGMLEETGFEIEHFSDETPALAGFAAQAIMGHGSLAEYFKAVVPEGDDPAAYCAYAAFDGGACPKELGYFLMVLRKKAV